MQAVLIGAITAAFFTGLGWFVSDWLHRRRLESARRTEVSLKHIESQIKDLYGPLLGLVDHSENIYRVAQKLLPQGMTEDRINFPRFKKQDTTVWRFFVESFFLPTHKEIRVLLRSQVHLLQSPDLPESFMQFLKYEADLYCRHTLWKDQGIDTRSIDAVEYPTDFRGDLERIIRNLHQQQQNLLATENEPMNESPSDKAGCPRVVAQECLLEEFRALRAEILARTDAQNKLINLACILSGSLLAIGIRYPQKPVFFLTIPILVCALAATWSRNDLMIKTIGGYIKYCIEPRCPGLAWETYLQKRRDEKGVFRSSFASLHVRSVFSILQLLPLILAVLMHGYWGLSWMLVTLGVGALVTTWILLKDRPLLQPPALEGKYEDRDSGKGAD